MKIESDNGVIKLIQGEREQSVWRRDDPDFIVNSYIRTIAIASLTWSGYIAKRRGRALMIGLGGGVFCKFLLRHFPNLAIEVVEPNQRVVELARQHFDLDHRVHVHTADGRGFLSKNSAKFDIIVLDAFDKTYIPPELMSAEFLSLVKESLTREGIFIANTWVVKNLTPHESATYRLVFENLWDFRRNPNTDGNRIILYNPAAGDKLATLAELAHNRAAYADAREQTLLTGSSRKLSYVEIAAKLRIGEVEPVRNPTILTDANARALRAAADFE